MSVVVCERCGCDELYRSRRRWLERWASVFGLYPFRCANCSHRALHAVARSGSQPETHDRELAE